MPAGQRTILLVEDDADVRDYLAEVLEKGGFDVLIAVDGAAALDMVRRGTHVDLLLTDLRMPKLNGLELARGIAAIDPGLKILFVSGYAGDLAEGLDLARFIAKPVSATELLRRVQRELMAV